MSRNTNLPPPKRRLYRMSVSNPVQRKKKRTTTSGKGPNFVWPKLSAMMRYGAISFRGMKALAMKLYPSRTLALLPTCRYNRFKLFILQIPCTLE